MGDHNGGGGRQILARSNAPQTVPVSNAPLGELNLAPIPKGLPIDQRAPAILAEIERMRLAGAYEEGVGPASNAPGKPRQARVHEKAALTNKVTLVGNALLPTNSHPRLVALNPNEWELRGQGDAVYARGSVNGLRRYATAVGAPVGLMVNLRGVTDSFRSEAILQRNIKPGVPGREDYRINRRAKRKPKANKQLE